MLNIDKLLKKKGWTGEELGRLELANTMEMFKQSIEGVSQPKPIISDADFTKMLRTLESREDLKAYNNFISIHEWWGKTYGTAIAHQQQAILNYNSLLFTVSSAVSAEDIYKYIEKLPAIMTEKQYSDLKEQKREEAIHPEGGEKGLNVFRLIDEAIDYYCQLLHKEPRKKNPLKPLKKDLEQELVKDPRILKNYNTTWGYGYCELPDGTRSDQVTEEEWHSLVFPLAEKIEKLADSSPAEWGDLKSFILEARHSARAEALLKGASEKEADAALNDFDTQQGLVNLPEWHYYEDPPEDLNKWEILDGGDLFSYYPALDLKGTKKQQLADAKAFKKEFPTVVEAILKDMEKYLPGVSTLPVEKWLDTVLTWEELYSMEAYSYTSERYTNGAILFEDNDRAYHNGVAILQPSTVYDEDEIDPETGYYAAPEVPNTLAELSLEGLFTDSEHYAENVADVEDARETFYFSLYFIKGYNLALDMIAEYYDLEEIKAGKLNLKSMDERIKDYNNTVEALYEQICNTSYEDPELKAKKLEVLRDVLYPLDASNMDPPAEAIAEVKEHFKDFSAFNDGRYDPVKYLCYREGV